MFVTLSACSKYEIESSDFKYFTEIDPDWIDANVETSPLDEFVKHDSLWYIDLTMDQALKLGISEKQYQATADNLDAVNQTLKEAYRAGQTVLFAEKEDDAVGTRRLDRETYATATIDGNCNNSAHALFFTHERTIGLSVSSSSGYWSLNINNQTVTGSNGGRSTITHADGMNTTMTYEWSLFIRSNFNVVAPAWIHIVFLNVNA